MEYLKLSFSSAVSVIQLAFFPPLLWYAPLGPLQCGWHQQQHCQNTTAFGVPRVKQNHLPYTAAAHPVNTDYCWQTSRGSRECSRWVPACSHLLLSCLRSSGVVGPGSPLSLYVLVLITFYLPLASTSLFSKFAFSYPGLQGWERVWVALTPAAWCLGSSESHCRESSSFRNQAGAALPRYGPVFKTM